MTDSLKESVDKLERAKKALELAKERTTVSHKRIDFYTGTYRDRLQYTLWNVAIATPALLVINSNALSLVACSQFIAPVALWLLRSADIALVLSIIVAMVVYGSINKNQQRLESMKLTAFSLEDISLRILDKGAIDDFIQQRDQHIAKLKAFAANPISNKMWNAAAKFQIVLVVLGYILAGVLLFASSPRPSCP